MTRTTLSWLGASLALWIATGALIAWRTENVFISTGTVAHQLERLPYGEQHWATLGFVEMVPAIELPRTDRSRTTVMIHVPQGEAIEIDPSSGTLVFPTGSTLDRVEWWRHGGQWRVADVRGTHMDHGTQMFRQFRPESVVRQAGQDYPLVGATWPRGDLSRAQEVREEFTHAFAIGAGFLSEPQDRTQSAERLLGLMDCANCHQNNTPQNMGQRIVHRGTSPQGFYVPHYAFNNMAPLETYRPVDPNAQSAHVIYRCGEQEIPTPTGFTSLRCLNGEVPLLEYRLADAVAAQEPHALAVCESRRRIFELLSAEAKHRIEPLLTRDCGPQHQLSGSVFVRDTL